MDFTGELKSRTRETESIIKEYLPVHDSYNVRLVEAMNYSIGSNGKRLRPLFMLSFFRLYSGSNMGIVKPFMAAMEMLHTYSLVHDDLPAIDNDDYRRGVFTTHKKYGEAVGILAGDGLLHLAYETALKAFDYAADISDLNADEPVNKDLYNTICALKLFGDKTGINGMLGGQAADVINTGHNIDNDLMYYIYEKKTGALIEGSMEIGAALAGAPKEDLEQIRKAGEKIGLAFQIQDDLLDLYGDEKELGKPVLSDVKNNKKTYVSVNGTDKSIADVKNFTQEAVDILDGLGNDAGEREFIKELFFSLTIRKK